MQFPNINPVIINLGGPLSIRWYSIPYIIGLILCRQYLIRINNQKQFCTKAQVDDIASIGLLSIVIGARIGYALIYDPKYYFSHPIEIVWLWHGGLSFHGGFAGCIIGVFLYCRIHKIQPHHIIDGVSLVIPIALFLGRLGNFINAELYGRPTNSKIGTVFPTDPFNTPRHPSQLYEAASEGILLFIVMTILHKNKKIGNKPYLLSTLCFILYSIIRFCTEFFREPDNHIGFIFQFLTMGQLLSVLSIVGGTIIAKHIITHYNNANTK